MDNRYNRHNRRKYSLKVDIVLVTKYRKQLLKDSIADDVNDIANTYGTNMVRFCLNSIGRKKILVRRIFCLQHWRSIVNYHTKIY